MMKNLRKIVATVAGLMVIATLAGCAATVSIESAPGANDPACANVIVRLPDVTDTQAKRTTDSQGTAAWGNPAVVTLRCGLAPIKVSALPCIKAGGIDWLVKRIDSKTYSFTSFGRTPATEVWVDSTKVSAATVLDDLGGPVGYTPRSAKCLG